MGLRNGLILLAGVALMLGGCSSESTSGLSGSDGFGQVSTDPESLCPSKSSPLPHVATARSVTTVRTTARSTSFTIPAGTVSFSIAVLGSSATLTKLIQPSGQDLFRQTSPNCDDTFGAFEQNWGGFSAFPLPVTEGTLPDAGTWSVEYWGDSEPMVFTRSAPLRSRATVTVQPYLTGTNYAASDLDSALEVLKRIFADNSIDVDLKSVTSLSDIRFATVSSSFQSSDTGDLVSEGREDAVNLFFIEDFSDASYLGKSSGIPGTLGLAGSFNGVLIALGAHDAPSSGLDAQLLGESAAHEMGHFLGLYHTSESNGFEFDPLSDTPECARASSGASACETADGSNLMFWASYSSLDRSNGKVQEVLSAQQQFVLRASPLAR